MKYEIMLLNVYSILFIIELVQVYRALIHTHTHTGNEIYYGANKAVFEIK